MKSVVVVESPAKAKTINKYLGPDFTVIASLGHVRDLPTKEGSVQPDEKFSMLWAPSDRGKQQLKAIETALKGADALYLATDPDREGEAISWHVFDMLKKKKILENKTVKRIVFYEITEAAVKNAFVNARDLDQDLVDAYLARRALDYLVGFTLSPVLWRKLPGSKSAGRVQSVALRLITDRETEIDLFKTQEYWTVAGTFRHDEKAVITAKLTHYEGEKVGKFFIPDDAHATAIVKTLKTADYQIEAVEKKRTKRHPAPPFTTSTLQQEASRKLRFSAKQTMRVAQQLYEGITLGGETTGLITYMRTDGVTMAAEAISQARQTIEQSFGKTYIPPQPNVYKVKAKNAQEAHEAIRPTSFMRIPADMKASLDEEQYKLYTLIWKRAMASQMASALLDQTAIDFADETKAHRFRATGAVIAFDGFLKLYIEDKDDETEQEGEGILPAVTEGQKTTLQDIQKDQHFTLPPPRYSEASLVKRLEELGIGRPSTWTNIINTLQERGYVKLEKRRFEPEARGRIVTSFLQNYFEQYIEYDFTANLENELDEISAGTRNWLHVLEKFWPNFKERTAEVTGFKNSDILDTINDELGPLIFGTEPNARECPTCKEGTIGIKNGRYGAFVGCSRYPDCTFTRQFTEEAIEGAEDSTASDFPKDIGKDPQTDSPIMLKLGPYGLYLEWTNDLNRLKKPKRASIPKGTPIEEITLKMAVDLSALPRKLGVHPETAEEISASMGPYGPYVKHGKAFISLKEYNVLSVTLDQAIEMIAADALKPKKPRRAKVVAKKPEAQKAPAKKSAVKKPAAKKTAVKK